nr:salicylate carboxymethyltransferase-like [Ipomoea batatas]
MKGGIGDTSYANNSLLQQNVILRAKPITDEAITSLYTNLNPKTICIADLGCSSGPNTFLAVSNLVRAVENQLAGSFYGRLFPTDSLHFVHSSYSLQWLSQVPQGLEGNKGNIWMATTSPRNVIKAYYTQFNTNFSIFLKCRLEELVKGGKMVLTIMGRKNDNPAFHPMDLLAMTLNDLAAEGYMEEEKLNSFNIPAYTPSLAEVKSLVENDGSFTIECLETFQIHWIGDEYDNDDNIGNNNNAAYKVARGLRAVIEPILVSRFGEGIIEEVFHRYRKMIADFMSRGKTEYTNIIISLIKK